MRRRDLLKTTTLGALMVPRLALSQASQTPASDRIGVGMIGVGSMGTQNLRDFLDNPDVNVVAICDVYKTNADKAISLTGGKAKYYLNYRRLLEDRDVQAVVISTPETGRSDRLRRFLTQHQRAGGRFKLYSRSIFGRRCQANRTAPLGHLVV